MTEDTPRPPPRTAAPEGQGPREDEPKGQGPSSPATTVPQPGNAEIIAGDDAFARQELQCLAENLSGHFPARYDRTELVLLDVDPHHLHAYWNIDQKALAKALSRLGPAGPQGPMLLRMRAVPPPGAEAGEPEAGDTFDVAVHGLRNRWYVDLWKDGYTYEAALGLRGPNGTAIWLAHSNRVRTPRAGQSPDYRFPTLTVPVAETRLADLPKGLPFRRPRVDPRFATLYPPPGAALPAPGGRGGIEPAAEGDPVTPPPDIRPSDIGASDIPPLEIDTLNTDALATDARAAEAAEADGATPDAVVAGTAQLPAGVSPGAAEATIAPVTPTAGRETAAAGPIDPPGAEAQATVPDLGPPPRVAAPDEDGAAADHPSGLVPSGIADERIARLGSGEAIPVAPPGAAERVAGLGDMFARLAETMDSVVEPSESTPEARTAVPSAEPAPPIGDAAKPAEAFAPGRTAVFGRDIDALGDSPAAAPFGPRGEPVALHDPPAHENGAASTPSDAPQAANGGHPPAGGDEPLPLESLLTLSSFAFGREDIALELNAELHIYGRARPGAKLTMFGQHLRLLPDGSFSIRRPLPHGSLVLPLLMSHGMGAGDGGGGD